LLNSSLLVSPSLKHLAIVLTPLLLAPNVGLAESAIKHQTVDLAPLDLRLRIETDRTTYRVGDPIRVRLTIVNKSAQRILIPPTNAPSMAVLLVYDGAGRKVAPTLRPLRRPFSGPTTPLGPQAEYTLPGSTPDQDRWVDLRELGYDLRSPGNYAIAGFTSLALPQRNPRLDPDRSLVKYNEVSVTITH
jgi:hypothetical protein